MLTILAVFFMVAAFSVVGIATASMSNTNWSSRRSHKNEALKFCLGISGAISSTISVVLLAVISEKFPQEVQNLPFALTVFSALFIVSVSQVIRNDISKFTGEFGKYARTARNRVHNFFIRPVRTVRKAFFQSSLGNCLLCIRFHSVVAFRRW